MFLCLTGFISTLKAGNCTDIPQISDTIPKTQDTIPKTGPPKKRSNITRYFNIITDQQQRDSLFLQLGRTNVPAPPADSAVWKSRENTFSVYRGKQIRYIYYNQLRVFGTTIEDTAVVPSNLVRFANRLHFDTRTWVIRQSLFFREGDTVNAYKLVDNERYLRRLPFIQDARIYVINSFETNDSIDIVVLTKDVFEYGGTISQFNNTQASATVFNNNLLGAGQKVALGFSWDNAYNPKWRTGASYTKYNVEGTFADVAVGYTMLRFKDFPLRLCEKCSCHCVVEEDTMGLKEYASKREFEKTPEPKPGVEPQGNRLMFVVHKHAARALHYDLRLELEGVLKSWAVPRGPSLDPSLKRLAVMVEDHPLDYKDFEGVIPEGNYGAGSVIIWDKGFYHHPSTRDEKESEKLLRDGLEKGDMKFVLEGEKLHGEFALVKTRKDGKSWLLLKKKDRNVAKGDVLKENRSVVSHKTLEELLETDARKSFKQKKVNQIRIYEAGEGEDLKDAGVTPMPHDIKPMLATPVEEPFDHPDWIFEVKWDGYRAVAEIRADGVSLYSRNGISFNKKFSPVVDALRKFGFDTVLDGEIVVVDDQGRPDFEALQHYQKSGSGHLLYYVFDLLYFRGHDLTGLPLVRRKELLKKILPASPKIRFSDHVGKDGVLFYRVSKEKGLEGIIAKHSQSVYETGRRSRQWLKVKTRLTQEAVIAGFTEPGGGRKYFGALVLGLYEGDELIYIGHSGGGFTANDLKDIRGKLEPLVQKECPFTVQPETNARVTWVKPELVCEVTLSGWTEDAIMRQPTFLRMREDKAAREVVREGESFRS